MAKRTKARLTAIFAIGGMSTLASILRNVILADNLEDPTYEYYPVYIWNAIDITFAVIVASLPALNRLVDVSIEKVKLYSSRAGNSGFVSASEGRSSVKEGSASELVKANSPYRQFDETQEVPMETFQRKNAATVDDKFQPSRDDFTFQQRRT
ncbi:hypothetical protein HYFRA_00007062 [Hymenoscyphus fraxineus]|uniref:Rhodopsin domain-containing protein n=1 Tax=Hymenoscyphus fraxineus TaxID=746836 RepID=A0A9N9KYS1_9HELO|nr:hypothetical protein HYFRA_00007062 [Hymenoscyphus fraxineus]